MTEHSTIYVGPVCMIVLLVTLFPLNIIQDLHHRERGQNGNDSVIAGR